MLDTTVRDRPILVVDDDSLAAQSLSLALQEKFAEVSTAGGGAEALDFIRRARPSLVISDLRMPGIDGLALLARIREVWPEIRFVLVTVEDDVATAVEAMRSGAADYLVKPVSPEILQDTASRILHQARPAVIEAQHEMGEILGESPGMVRVRRKILEAAYTDLNVLIVGETGTGKELAARAIHRLSRRSSSEFVAHNCAATPSDLFESLFFGHQKGAFTGAERDQRGLLEQADGGTIFLDELECLAPGHQAKLLRVMDDGMLRPVGSQSSKQVSVRFVGATNRDPVQALKEGTLRSDLFFRLGGVEVALPPLRSRSEDIAILVSHFLEGLGIDIDSGALEALQSHSWPGNVRQLRNLLWATLPRVRHRTMRKRDLDFGGTSCGSFVSCAQDGPAVSNAFESAHTLKEAEKQMILRALAEAGGNCSAAARLLGIHRATLRRKLRELRMSGGG